MALGYFMASPILLINMGGEMIYILEQRLRAQNIEAEKGQRVLNDILQTLFAPEFLEQLFKPQKTFTINFIRSLFDKVVHCSIMKLNETSMNKLFDLILMGVKLQLFNTQSPHDIYFITLNHLTGIMNILQQGNSMDFLIQCQKQFIKTYSCLEPMEFILLKSEIVKFLQEKQVRVFMFMQEKLQNNDGSFVITNNQGPSPAFIEKPGMVHIYNSKGSLVKKKQLVLKVGNHFQPSNQTTFLEKSTTQWGQNLYSAERKIQITQQKAGKGFQDDQQLKRALKINEQQAKSNMNNLASMIRNDNEDDTNEDFSISIISKNTASTISRNQGGGNNSDVIDIDQDNFLCDLVVAESKQSGKQQLKSKVDDLFGGLDIKEEQQKSDEQMQQQANEDDDDDLLDMMDNL